MSDDDGWFREFSRHPHHGILMQVTCPDGDGTAMTDRTRLHPKERAVIEAAKACVPELRNWVRRHYELFGTSNPHYKNEMAELLDTVEALQEVEGDD